MTEEHMKLCMAFRIPFMIVLTKKDICPKNIYKQTKERLGKVLKRFNKKTLYMKNDDEI